MKQKRKGFTLVELIVVIAIIGILAAVLIPTFSGAIESARKADDRLTVSNMNKTLTAYLAYHQIDAKDLDASEVQYIVSTEEEQYTFQPAFEGGVFWYNSNAGRIEYAETMGNPATTISGTTMALADGPANGPTSIEDVYGNGYLYLNASGELATFLLNLRNLGSVQDYKNLKASVKALAEGNGTLDGVPAANLQTICEKFDPAQTLYISSSGGFVDYEQYNSVEYANKPVYNGTSWTISGAAVTGVTLTDKAYPYLKSQLLAMGVAETAIDPDETYADWEDYWVFQDYDNDGALIYKVPTNTAKPVTNGIKNVVFATGLRVVPALNLTRSIEVEGTITLPATVYTVMKDAFTNVTSETQLTAKSQYTEVITGALGTNMTTSIAQKSETALMNNVKTGNELLKVYLFKHEEVYDDGFIFGWGSSYASLATAKELGTPDENGNIVKDEEIIGYVFSNTSPEGFIGKIDTTKYAVGSEAGAYRLYLDTSELAEQFQTIHTIDVKYAPRSMGDEEVYDITIQAFDNSGMCLNLVVTYKQPATEEAA